MAPATTSIVEAAKQPKTTAAFKGFLSVKEADELPEYVAKSREEWKGIFDGMQKDHDFGRKAPANIMQTEYNNLGMWGYKGPRR